MQVCHHRRVVAHDLNRHRLRIALGLFGGHSRLQPPHHLVAPVGRGCGRKFRGRETHRNPQLRPVQLPGVERKLKVARHHADHDIRLSVQQNLLAQNLRVSMKAAHPCRVTQDGYLLAVLVLIRRKNPPKLRTDSKRRKDPRRHPRRIHLRRLPNPGKLEPRALVASKRCKPMRIARVSPDIRHRHAHFVKAANIHPFQLVTQCHQPPRIRKRKRSQDHCLDNRKDRRRRTNTKRQHQHRGNGKPRRFHQLPQHKTEIEKKLLHGEFLSK